MAENWTKIFTIGQIARRLDEPLHRVEYAIKSRGVEPRAFAGNARVFDERAIELVAAALRGIDASRKGGDRCAP